MCGERCEKRFGGRPGEDPLEKGPWCGHGEAQEEDQGPGQTHLFQSCSPGGGGDPRESGFSHLCGGDDHTAGLDGITGEKAPPWLPQVPALLNIPLFSIGLALLGAFNVDENWIRVTPEEHGPYVLSSLLHKDPSSNQTW